MGEGSRGTGKGPGRGCGTATIVACPICRKSVAWVPENRFRPFCSDRCRLIDLGAWADGQRYIPGEEGFGDALLDGGDPEDP